ncbi:GNAT family N-acetyltransferase [Ruegeria arenilitoris]|uniref:GNAT family N-acetyltransferase n=1 Tax=Ruegeria arenilitoris TaxID=1173585 RepID=UPI001479F881|nr:GNAT family N-acetyltransferase [Ruegeria arenilitoris]
MIAIRPMITEDVADACGVLNRIIVAGGTTAHEVPFSNILFLKSFLYRADTISCQVALDERGTVAGFQWLGVHDQLPDCCVDIEIFTRREPVLKGAGRILLEKTKGVAIELGYRSINAAIRADKVIGLSYYDKMGFSDFSVERGVPLRDGKPIDRISKSFKLNEDRQC